MLRYLWRRYLADRISNNITARITPDLDRRIAAALAAQDCIIRSADLSAVHSKMDIATVSKPWNNNFYVPPIGFLPAADGPFMAHSTCAANDFYHAEFSRLCATLGLTPDLHRKRWEWVYVLHHAIRTGAVFPGSRALGFAVGTEPLPSAFARIGVNVSATDAPEDIGVEKGWSTSGQHASKLDDLYHPAVVDRATFDAKVTFSPCDMTRISAEFSDYDFCWSSCSFEHLGSLKAGLDFVIETVEKTLKRGGVACHTTEFNLSSDGDTILDGPTVIYRKQDILGVIEALERRGHSVDPFSIAPTTHMLDHLVDTPPFGESPHLKLRLLGYVSTSVGLVIRRGR